MGVRTPPGGLVIPGGVSIRPTPFEGAQGPLRATNTPARVDRGWGTSAGPHSLPLDFSGLPLKSRRGVHTMYALRCEDSHWFCVVAASVQEVCRDLGLRDWTTAVEPLGEVPVWLGLREVSRVRISHPNRVRFLQAETVDQATEQAALSRVRLRWRGRVRSSRGEHRERSA